MISKACLYFSFTIALTLLTSQAHAQTWKLPDSQRNTRHSDDLLAQIVRPALTMRGFDNEDLPTADAVNTKIYGVKQVLERAYDLGGGFDVSVKDVLIRILDESQFSFTYGSTPGDIEADMSILKSRAAIALLTYVIELNDGGTGEPNIFTSGVKTQISDMPSHSDAMAALMSYLENTPTPYFPGHPTDDVFKNAKAGMNLAQAWDLYLALENAYEEFETSTYCDSELLSSSVKEEWNERLWSYVEAIYTGTRSNSPLWGDLNIPGLGLHEIQAGNWPLIGFVACGYIIMGFNGDFPNITIPDHILFPVQHSSADIFGNALLSSYTTKGSGTDQRRYYFHYQTGGGQRYWAEGAHYFSIVLEYLVPFYHALRANWFLPETNSTGTLTDPFVDSKFLNSVEWLADIATPDGKTPAIDDGRKEWIFPAQILNWSSDYGNSSTGAIGEKFQRLVDLPDMLDMVGGGGMVNLTG